MTTILLEGEKMKKRIMFNLVLVALFVFGQNLFALEGAPEPEVPEADHEGIVLPQETQDFYNTFYGLFAGESITDGEYNSFFGYAAGRSNTTGDYNSLFGAGAGNNNETGDYNSFFGRSAGYANTTGDENSFFGRAAGYSNRTGNNNSFFGRGAGFNNSQGSGNVFLGFKAGYNETESDKLYIANTDSDTRPPLIYGEFDNQFVKINANFTATATSISSDIRWKKNVQPLKSSLASVSALQGVSYEWKVDEYRNLPFKEGRQIGLVAQDVEKVLPELVVEDKDGYKAVSYAKLTAVLIEAVKELKTENEKKERLLMEKIRKQQSEIEELRNMVSQLNS